MGAPQTIRTDAGEELVVLARRDYEALLALAGDAEAENRLSEHILAAAQAAARVSTVQPLPADLWEELEQAGNAAAARRVRILRRARGLKLQQLADLSQSDVEGIESGREPGSPAVFRRLAQLLAVDYETLARENASNV